MASDPRELLRQYIESYTGELPGPWPNDPDGGQLRVAVALRAVLDLHKPVRGDESWCDEDGFTYPCLTVRAITRELEKP